MPQHRASVSASLILMVLVASLEESGQIHSGRLDCFSAHCPYFEDQKPDEVTAGPIANKDVIIGRIGAYTPEKRDMIKIA